MGLKRTSNPTTTPVTVSEAKDQISLLSNDHDTTIDRLIKAATEAAEKYTGRALITQTWRLALNSFPVREIRLPRPTLQSITSIQYVDENGTLQTLGASLYDATADLEPARVEPAYGEVWPATRCEREAVRITYVAGYGDASTSVPESIRHAILLMVSQWFEYREPTSEKSIKEIPMSACWLLDGFKTGAGAEWFNLAE
jgi:uncharacterized phiE125 gp8 family phage protein